MPSISEFVSPHTTETEDQQEEQYPDLEFDHLTFFGNNS